MDVVAESKVEVVAPNTQFANATTTTSNTATTRDQAVAKDQTSAVADEKKKPWYKRIKLQPVIYRGKCGI